MFTASTRRTHVRMAQPDSRPAGRARRACCLALALVALRLPADAQTPEAPPQSHRTLPPTLMMMRSLNPWLSPSDPRELPMKVRSILADEFRFFRGTDDLFYAWCRIHCADWLADDAGDVLLHGDVHIGNVGTYHAEGPVGAAIHLGLIDLDETFVGPFQLDLLRAACSIRFQAALDSTLDNDAADRAVRALCNAYRAALRGQRTADQLAAEEPVLARLLDEARAGKLAKHGRKYSTGDNRPVFRPLIVRNDVPRELLTPIDDETRRVLVGALARYWAGADGAALRARLRWKTRAELEQSVLDVAQWTKLSSSGSQGVRKYLLLLKDPLREAEGPFILHFKESPVPAAARAGLIPAEHGATRSRFVARAHARLQSPPQWLIGYTEFDGRGYLIKPKDPFSEEPDAEDFPGPDGLRRAAVVLGVLLGAAHRHAATSVDDADANHAPTADAIAQRADELEQPILERSVRATAHLRERFGNLRDDPAAAALAAQADDLIRTRANEPPGD